MDELDFGEGFYVLVAIAAYGYTFLKSLIMLLLCYLPAQYTYRRFLKGDQVFENFFKSFFCWAIIVSILNIPIYFFRTIFKIEALDDFLMLFNSNFHFGKMLFFHFLFWTYSFDPISKKIFVLKELNLKKKLLRFSLFFSLLFVLGFFIQTDHYVDTYYHWIINHLIFFASLFIFLKILNVKS